MLSSRSPQRRPAAGLPAGVLGRVKGMVRGLSGKAGNSSAFNCLGVNDCIVLFRVAL